MNTLVNTVFKSKMKTANTRFEDKYQKIKKCGNARKARLSDDLKTIMRGSTLCTTCGEHIVHIDGVTGSSPVATTIKPRRHKVFEVFSVSRTSTLLPPGEGLATILSASLNHALFRTFLSLRFQFHSRC